MAPNPRLADRRLEELYASLPTIDCDGRCWRTCSVIPCSVRERERVKAVLGKQLAAPLPEMRCNALSEEGRCTVYEVRPLICRLYGLTEGLKCEYGCKPAPGYLTDAEAAVLLKRTLEIGGNPGSYLLQVAIATGKAEA